MKKSFKFVSLLLTASLTASLLAGCGGSGGKDSAKDDTQKASDEIPGYLNSETFPIVKEPITVTGFGSKNVTHNDWDKMLCFTEYEKMTNIKVQWNTPPSQGYVEKKNLILASGDLPDFFMRGGLNPADEVNYGSQGVLIPLNDLIKKYAPNITKRMEEYPEFRKSITQPDGNIYSLPQVEGSIASSVQKMWINKVWLDNLKLSMPKTTDEFLAVLIAFRDNDPNKNGKKDEIPVSDRDKGGGPLRQLNAAWGLGNLGKVMAGNFVDKGPDGKLRFFAKDQKYKEFLEYMNKLHKEKLLDPEIFTQGVPEFTAKGEQGLVGTFMINANPEIIGKKHQDDYVAVPALKGPYGDQIWTDINALASDGSFAITNKCKYPEAMIRWVDYFYGLEGSKLIRMGIEGKTYHKNSDGSYVMDKEITNNPNGLNFPQAIGQYAPGIAGGGVASFVFEELEKIRLPKSVYDGTEVLKPYLIESVVKPTFTTEEQEQLNALQSDINTYVKEMQVKFTVGDEPLSNWNNYVNRLNQMGVDKIMKIYQDAYDRWLKS